MKKRKNLILWLITVMMAALLFTGCTPPNYSEEAVNKIEDEHYQDVVDYFAQNLPEAQVSKKFKAYRTAVDLYQAIEGNYKIDGKTHKYIYDYVNEQLYTDQYYEEACQLIQNKIYQEFQLEEERTKTTFLGSNLYLHFANDQEKHGLNDEFYEGEEEGLCVDSVLPFGVSAEDYAKQALDGEVTFEFMVMAYVEEFPEYDVAQYDPYHNLMGIWYTVPVIEENDEFCGAYEKAYSWDWCHEKFCHLKEVEDGFYVGYELDGTPDMEDVLEFTRDSETGFNLTIPEAANPLIFSEWKKDYVISFPSSSGETKENDVNEMGRNDCRGFDDDYIFNATYITSKEIHYGGYYMKVSSAHGTYHFEEK
ncbi:MAG: hypothetical protein MJ086_05095 [Lachnospiraceae bacterium]|nr:hypothetical protein [Lachnospiraceae bacterium]